MMKMIRRKTHHSEESNDSPPNPDLVALRKWAQEKEAKIASLSPLVESGQWTVEVQNVHELVKMVRAIPDEDWIQMQHRFTRIHVKNHAFTFLNDEDIDFLSLRLLPCVRALRIDDLVDENGTVLSMAALDGRGCHYFLPLEWFGSALVHLELRATDMIGTFRDDSSLVSLDVSSLELEHLTSLRYLKLSCFSFCGNNGIFPLQSCPSLEHVVFECCQWGREKDTVDRISEALRKCDRLRAFSMVGSPSYRSNLSVKPQAPGWDFQEQNFALCLGHGGAFKVLPKLPPTVEEVDLSSSPMIRDVSSLKEIKNTLKRVNLSLCPFIDDEVVSVLSECHLLEQISLDGTAVTDISLLRNCPKLRLLSLRTANCNDPLLEPEWIEFIKEKDSLIVWRPARGKLEKTTSAEEGKQTDSRYGAVAERVGGGSQKKHC